MSVLQTVQKKQQTIYLWTDSAKKLHWSIYSAPDSAKKQQQQFTYGQTVQKSNSNLHMDSTYLQTVQKTMCKYTYIYSVHIVYYKDILNYQRHQDKKTMSSSEDEVDSLFEESMVGRINSLEKFAAEEFSS